MTALSINIYVSFPGNSSRQTGPHVNREAKWLEPSTAALISILQGEDSSVSSLSIPLSSRMAGMIPIGALRMSHRTWGPDSSCTENTALETTTSKFIGHQEEASDSVVCSEHWRRARISPRVGTVRVSWRASWLSKSSHRRSCVG